MNEKVKFAVVGCGSIGARHIAVIDADPRATLVAVCDNDPVKLEKQASLYNVPGYENFSDLLKTDAEVINICTPHEWHCPMSIEAARAKKHILVEKPMALSAKCGNRMIDEAKKQGVELMVVKQNRFNKPIALLKEAVDTGKLGKIFMVQCNVIWNRGEDYYLGSEWRGRKHSEGGALFTQVSHFLDILIWWFGDVRASQSTVQTKLHSIETDDCGSATINFDSGVIGSLNWTTCAYNKNYEGSITIIAENGTVKIGGPYLNKVEFWDVKDNPLPDNIDFNDQPNNYGKYQGSSSNHHHVVNAVIDQVLKKQDAQVVHGPEGLKSIEAIETIYNWLSVECPGKEICKQSDLGKKKTERSDCHSEDETMATA